MRRAVLIPLLLTGCLAVAAGCDNASKPEVLSLKNVESVEPEEDRSGAEPLRMAIGSMITPQAGFSYYWQLLKLLEEKLKMPVEFVDRESYAEINELIRRKEIDVAFVCSKPYVDGHREFGMQLLAAPQAYGKAVYHSYVIVSSESEVTNLSGLRGKTFAFVDPQSNTGKLAPTIMLAKMGETPDAFFEKYNYTYAHDKSIFAVAEGIVDGAAVDSLVWEYLLRTDPRTVEKTRIIAESPPFGIPPVVVRAGLDPSLVQKVRQVLMTIHEDEKGRAILDGMKIDRFVEIEDSAYDSIREMELLLLQQGEG